MPQFSGESVTCVVGVDVGGTKIAAAVVDESGNLLSCARFPTDTSHPEATLDSIAHAARQAIESFGSNEKCLAGIGLGIPGLVDPILGIGLASVNLNWKDVAVVAGLERRLSLPCRIENDVKAAGLGEARFGAAQGKSRFIYLTIGTGVAAAIILDGQVVRGSHGLAGEIGHAVFDPRGPRCKCGGTGCLEALVSGPSIAARATGKLRAPGTNSILQLNGLSAQQVFSAASQGDALSQETVDETCRYLAQAVQWLALAYDPEIIVLGGGVSKAGAGLLQPLTHHLRGLAEASWVFGRIYHPELVQISPLGENSGILGAAALFA